MSLSPRPSNIKRFLGNFPFSSKLYQRLNPETIPPGSFDMPQLAPLLDRWIAAANSTEPCVPSEDRKRVLIVGLLKWWFEYGLALGFLLDAVGHEVELAYLPYRDWTSPVTRFDARRGAHYLANLFKAEHLPISLRNLLEQKKTELPVEIEHAIEQQTLLDVQYTLQREDIDYRGEVKASELYRLRLGRNRTAASGAYTLLTTVDYDTIVIPNGSILEFGVIYRVAAYLGKDTVTYEFGEQRERVWLAQNSEVMQQETDDMWSAVGEIPLTAAEQHKIEELFSARRGGRTWAQFGRQWQSSESQGAQRARSQLGLDPNRPVALLCTNVVGDSLALNRQVFTDSMADWLSRTVELFSDMSDCQLVVRVHPGEMLGTGHPSVDIIKNSLPEQPDHVIVVPPQSDINTYDLIELAKVGLVYTTTFGLEMCMHGVPVIVSGSTHYKGKGFTVDPEDWNEYVDRLKILLHSKPRVGISDAAVKIAWRYAYRYFFDYPFHIPWHLISFWDDLDERPLQQMTVGENLQRYLITLQAFAGLPIDWGEKVRTEDHPEVAIERS